MLIQQQLIGSIKYRINLGENKEVIIKSLLDQGCIQQDIDNAFYVIENAQSIAENQLLEAAKESNKKNIIIVTVFLLILVIGGGWYYINKTNNEKDMALMVDVTCATMQNSKEFLAAHPEIKTSEDINNLSASATEEMANSQKELEAIVALIMKKYNLNKEEFTKRTLNARELLKNSTSLMKDFTNKILEKGCLFR